MIEFDGVSKRFGSQEVLRGLTLRVPTGSSLALLGPSGAGKSVLLKTVIGLIEPDEGDVRVGGRSVVHDDARGLPAVRRQVGYIFQSSALFDSLTVEENVLFGLDDQVWRAKPQWCRQRVEQCMRWVNLEPEAAAKYPAELSGGMQKRVAIARAIAGEQRYLLCDEPTTGLDPMNAGLIAELLRRLQRQLGATTIVVTHDLTLARFVTDR
ncbi:MAG: ATP-binding cassette domain-containing protein, partial [Gemmatimonadetes bacterium]|nr:ATP-binding cassette domain-containing protein [Gemmatimonadota bacterium]